MAMHACIPIHQDAMENRNFFQHMLHGSMLLCVTLTLSLHPAVLLVGVHCNKLQAADLVCCSSAAAADDQVSHISYNGPHPEAG